MLDHPPLLDVHEQEIAHDRRHPEQGQTAANVEDRVLQVEFAAASFNCDDELELDNKKLKTFLDINQCLSCSGAQVSWHVSTCQET